MSTPVSLLIVDELFTYRFKIEIYLNDLVFVQLFCRVNDSILG